MNRIHINTVVYLALVYMWCSLHTGRSPLVVTAQPMLSVEILTTEADRKEGGQVHMQCTATNFDFQIYTLGWEKAILL